MVKLRNVRSFQPIIKHGGLDFVGPSIKMTRIYKKWLPALCGEPPWTKSLVRSFVPSENWQHLPGADRRHPHLCAGISNDQILWTKSGREFSDIQISRSKISRTFSASEMRKAGSQISLSLVKLWSPQKNPMDIMHGNFLKTLCVSLSFDCWWLLWVTTIHIIDTTCASKTSMFTHTFFTSRIQKLDIHSRKNRWPTCIYVLGSKL